MSVTIEERIIKPGNRVLVLLYGKPVKAVVTQVCGEYCSIEYNGREVMLNCNMIVAVEPQMITDFRARIAKLVQKHGR